MNNTTMQDDAADSASMEERTTAVTAIELLFDLVFVAAIGQLATTLHDHVTWRGGLETMVLWVPPFPRGHGVALSVSHRLDHRHFR